MTEQTPEMEADSRALRYWRGVALALAAIVAALAFAAYARPDLLLEFANLRYCG